MNSRYVSCSMTETGFRDATGPHGVPDLIDLGLQLTRDHDSTSPVSIEFLSRLNLEVSPSGMCRSLVVAKSDGSWTPYYQAMLPGFDGGVTAR